MGHQQPGGGQRERERMRERERERMRENERERIHFTNSFSEGPVRIFSQHSIHVCLKSDDEGKKQGKEVKKRKRKNEKTNFISVVVQVHELFLTNFKLK